ncbi:hypothetical protein FZEAL_5173 [Fusarium zealandicum]|uniref:Uncharacterized protein n=1 Tax=Fusarium zealandicum TaxID=1053134 RepID=A0A8H4UKX2_9HYPO|nr:hypothetical protein FZEAL_5173 [Fusarium zealandicum]
MDPFSKLPAEIRLQVIICSESEASIMQLIRASLTMLAQYVTCRKSIMKSIVRSLLRSDTSGALLQDALRIIRFPSLDFTSSPESISGILERWMSQRHSDALAPTDYGTIQKLYSLLSRMVMFIEDYVSKATDPFPPRAYLTLPAFISGGTGMHFMGRNVDIKRAQFSEFTTSERNAFLRAFLRYELLCKVYHPQVWDLVKQSSYPDLVKTLNDELEPIG